MHSIPAPAHFSQWRSAARSLLQSEVHPQDTLWQSDEQADSLFGGSQLVQVKSKKPKEHKVSAAFMDIAKTAACHRSGDQWALLYSILWRLTHGEPHLLQIASDDEVHRVQSMIKQIRRDCHKMHAFVRFRKVGEDTDSGREQFVSWFEPDHKIVRLNASFFKKRFANMDWSILTPDECMHWDGVKVRYSAGVTKDEAPDGDALEELWKSYYKSIFNVARVKVKAMQSEMPKKYWKNLPEAELIEGLIASSRDATAQMLENPNSPEKPMPKNAYLKKLHQLDEKNS